MGAWITDTGREVAEERTEENIWLMGVKHGNFIVYLIHPLEAKFVDVRFSFKLNPEFKTTLISTIADPISASKLLYGLKSAISNFNTSYSLDLEKISENVNIPVGFNIDAKIFPLDKFFSLHHLETSIQNVVNAGVFGISFLSSILQVNEASIKQQEAMTSSPEGMYF
jgi:hypothetical protein